METMTTESTSKSAAKVAGFAAGIALTGALVIKAGRFVGRKIRSRRPLHAVTTEQ